MGNENSQPAQEGNKIVESARSLIEKVTNLFQSSSESEEEEKSHSPRPKSVIPTGPIVYPDENWFELFESLPLEILYSIFYYLQLNFKNVISLRLVSKQWSDYIFSRIPMDLDASFISFKRLNFLPLISGLSVAGNALTTMTLKDILKITSLRRLNIGHDKPTQVDSYLYDGLNKLENLTDLALVNLTSLPKELSLSKLSYLNKLEISGVNAAFTLRGLSNMTQLNTFILMRQSNPNLMPLSQIGSLTNLQYLQLFGMTTSQDFDYETAGFKKLTKLKTLKLATERPWRLAENFFTLIPTVDYLALTSFTLPKSITVDALKNIKKLYLFSVPEINQEVIFSLPNLEILKLEPENGKLSLSLKPDWTKKCQNLRELVLPSCIFTEEVCAAITQFPNLAYLSVPLSSGLELPQIYKFAAMPTLRVLNLSYNHAAYWAINQDFFSRMVAHSKVLRTVYLIGFQFYGSIPEGIEFLFSR